MSQVIKFVYENGKVRTQKPSVDLTKEVIKTLQHDYAEHMPGGGLNKVKYFTLVEGNFAPEPTKKKHYHAHGTR